MGEEREGKRKVNI